MVLVDRVVAVLRAIARVVVVVLVERFGIRSGSVIIKPTDV